MVDVEQLQKENQELQIAINELKVLNDVATAISSLQSVEEIIDKIVLKCIEHLDVEEGTISLLDRDSDEQNFNTVVRHKDTSTTKVPYRMDSGLKGWMLKNRSSFISNNIHEDERFQFLSGDEYTFESILCVPLIVQGDLIGYLAVFNKKNDPFKNQDRRLLSIIGAQSAQILENARLYEEEKAFLSLKKELKLAGEIQQKLLPDNLPDIAGYQIFALNKPAKSVGGDYYDFVNLPDERLAFCIGDITGKGMPAAMLMANLQATFRSQVHVDEECRNCMSRTNTLLFKNTETKKFATMFYGILEPDSGVVKYTNAGHDIPFLFRLDNQPDKLKTTGLILGIFENSDYSTESVQLEEGDLLLLFSDGITEAMDSNSEPFGKDRLEKLVHKNRKKTASEVGKLILNEINSHTKGAIQSDDITLMIIKRKLDSPDLKN